MSEPDQKAAKRDLDRTQTKARADRRQDAQRQWRITPIREYNKKLDHLTDKDRKNRLRAIREFEQHILDQVATQTEHDILGVRDAIKDDVSHWKDESLLQSELALVTIEERLQYLKSFYTTLNQQDAFAGNPVRSPLADFRENYDDRLGTSGRPYIPLNRLRTFMDWLDTPLARALWLLAFKIGNRKGESINLDLRCLHIAHPVFEQVITKHGIELDPRVRDRPDTVLVYGGFNKGTEIPNNDTQGWQGDGEIRETGNKRKRDSGSVLPIDDELKTALIEWLLIRPPTIDHELHPVFTTGVAPRTRISPQAVEGRLWRRDSYIDSIRRFAQSQSLDECPTCGSPITAQNLDSGEKTGRRYHCRNCTAVHWRSIFWGPTLNAESYDEFDTTYDTSQVMRYHQGRHSFSSAHSAKNSDLHDGVIPKAVRTEAIRGDSNNQGDTEDQVYIEGQYQDFEKDVRQPYLDGIYKFEMYDDPIPAVGEGWDL